ncbi:P-loop NTPase fold protein [Cronobacter sakazakii]|uniref:KAP family P-loop NTPase fold protein n=1 Tax=Cronobacter sakazakii TaxID=28141 RepID=UPI0006D0EA41|nr:P-loop NTPase fold protein [Cronobacter sakazakii]ELY2490618.1 NTPase [Cronobacter sakazakii]ELY4848048.1 NTPase [Cronobacter sakazakii]ELY6251985.1 NTPase [Cronobacter sakazakii]EMD7598534.1 NTPase [Cronobacter sakazakii]KAB1034467.1 NTPase [Cronobacter sakazakii]
MSITFDDRDEYQRKKIAEKLAQIIDSSLDISPTVIDGNWGTGKTEFSLKLLNYISTEYKNKKVIYIDAFKEDHCADPLLSVTAAIANAMPRAKQKALIEKAIPALKFTATTALKATAGWVLKQETDNLTEDFQQAIKDTSNAAIDGTIENLIKNHMEAETNISALKEKIRELASENQIIIIVDELDRCKPNYSIDMLEKIKHIFDIENVFFILVTNLSQLKASINHLYGASVNAQIYLDKFIKYSLTLPETFKPDGHTLTHTSEHHWQGLIAKSTDFKDSGNVVEPIIGELLSIRPLSLRETETLFRYYSIFQSLSKVPISNQKLYSYNLAALVAIYFYCFGDKRDISKFPSDDAIISLAHTLGVITLEPDTTKPHIISHYNYVLYGLIKENGGSPSSLLPSNYEKQKNLETMYDTLSERGFNRFSFIRVFTSVFETLSLT